MQFSNTLIALVAAGLASAQFEDIPQCSLNCFTSALTSDGCSGLTDFECHCGKPQLVSQVTPCVKKACEEADQSTVSSVVESICKDAGVPISVPEVGGGSEPTTTAEEPTSTAEEPTEPTEEPTGEPTEEPTTTGAPAYPTGSESPSSSATPSPSSSATPSGSESASPSAPTFTGAATKNNVGGVAALAMAAAYYL